MTAILVSTIAGVGLLGVAADDDPPAEPKRPKSMLLGVSSAYYEPPCTDAQKGITFYRRSYAKNRAAMGLSGPVARHWYHDCAVVRRRAGEWRVRAQIERAVFVEWNSTVGRIVRRLDAGLAGTPMAGLGVTLEAAGRKYGVSPFFMAAAAGTESSFGVAGCSGNRKNVWGLAACDGRWHVPYFETWEEAIGFYANFLSSRWPNASTPYEYYRYAACDVCWGRKTTLHMGRFGVGNSTRYEAVAP